MTDILGFLKTSHPVDTSRPSSAFRTGPMSLQSVAEEGSLKTLWRDAEERRDFFDTAAAAAAAAAPPRQPERERRGRD